MIASNKLYEELNYNLEEQEIYTKIEEGLRNNNGVFKYEYSNTPLPILYRVSENLTQLGYKQKTKVIINEGKFLEVIV